MKIRIFATGGTFDKEYDPVSQQLYLRDTHLPEMLEFVRCRLDVEIEKLMFKDSLEMTETDREIMALKCKEAKEDHIVMTHGTDTMAQTAALIAKHQLKKTIVLRGAMIPYKYDGSCALFNLGSALAFAQTLPPGVYVSMDGRYFKWDNFKKNKETGEFETMDKP